MWQWCQFNIYGRIKKKYPTMISEKRAGDDVIVTDYVVFN